MASFKLEKPNRTQLGIFVITLLALIFTKPSKVSYSELALLEYKQNIELAMCSQQKISQDCKESLTLLSQGNSSYFRDWLYQNSTCHNYVLAIFCYFEYISSSGGDPTAVTTNVTTVTTNEITATLGFAGRFFTLLEPSGL